MYPSMKQIKNPKNLQKISKTGKVNISLKGDLLDSANKKEDDQLKFESWVIDNCSEYVPNAYFQMSVIFHIT